MPDIANIVINTQQLQNKLYKRYLESILFQMALYVFGGGRVSEYKTIHCIHNSLSHLISEIL